MEGARADYFDAGLGDEGVSKVKNNQLLLSINFFIGILCSHCICVDIEHCVSFCFVIFFMMHCINCFVTCVMI